MKTSNQTQRINREERDYESLLQELEQFKSEKEQIRMLIGQIGGSKTEKRDTYITWSFIISIIILFLVDILRHIVHIDIPLPSMFSLQLGVLLVSLKIIWMMHKQGKVEHFQFWILNSIEFRLNELAKDIRQLKE